MSGKGICCGPTLASIILTFAECSGIYDMALLVVGMLCARGRRGDPGSVGGRQALGNWGWDPPVLEQSQSG